MKNGSVWFTNNNFKLVLSFYNKALISCIYYILIHWIGCILEVCHSYDNIINDVLGILVLLKFMWEKGALLNLSKLKILFQLDLAKNCIHKPIIHLTCIVETSMCNEEEWYLREAWKDKRVCSFGNTRGQ